MGHSAGGHLALLYAYKSAAGHTINGNPMHPISLVISEAGPINLTVDEVGKLLPQNQNEICAMAGISSLNDTNAQNALNAVSPYCVAQDIDDKSKLPYTILAYGNIFDNGNATNSDGLIPIQPAKDLEAFLNTNNDEYVNHSKCSLFELNNVSHSDFGITVHPDTDYTHYTNRVNQYLQNLWCLNCINRNCTECQQIRQTERNRIGRIDRTAIYNYYDCFSSKF